MIDPGDRVFSSLRIWQDKNHNGVSDPGELHTLTELGIGAISLHYQETRWVDANGNQFRYRAKVLDMKGSDIGKWSYDVILSTLQTVPPKR